LGNFSFPHHYHQYFCYAFPLLASFRTSKVFDFEVKALPQRLFLSPLLDLALSMRTFIFPSGPTLLGPLFIVPTTYIVFPIGRFSFFFRPLVLFRRLAFKIFPVGFSLFLGRRRYSELVPPLSCVPPPLSSAFISWTKLHAKLPFFFSIFYDEKFSVLLHPPILDVVGARHSFVLPPKLLSFFNLSLPPA